MNSHGVWINREHKLKCSIDKAHLLQALTRLHCAVHTLTWSVSAEGPELLKQTVTSPPVICKPSDQAAEVGEQGGENDTVAKTWVQLTRKLSGLAIPL